LEFPVYVVQHCSQDPASPLRPGHVGNELKSFVRPKENERLIKKHYTNAFIETDLLQQLRDDSVAVIVICGFVTNNSVEATARMAGELGFKVTVVSDATATFDKRGIDNRVYSSELIHQISLANLNGEYAAIETTAEVVNRINQMTSKK